MRKSLPTYAFAAILSVLNLLLFNIPFFRFVAEHLEANPWQQTFFIGSLVIVMLALHFLVFYLLLQLLRKAGKILIATLFLLSGICVYFVVTYHNLMDEAMMSNIFNTRYSEASGFFNTKLWISIALWGVIPCGYVLYQRIHADKWRIFGWSCLGSLLLSAVLVLINLNQVLWIGKYDTELGGLIMPWSYVVNSSLHAKHHHNQNKDEILLPDASIADSERAAIVLVIGESARRANFQLYGYERETNPRLSLIPDLITYPANACATYTTAGVKCILEHQPSRRLYEILPNYLYRTGVDVAWRTHNWGEPPLHISDIQSIRQLAAATGIEGELYDEILFRGIKERIMQSLSAKTLIVLHTNTSHGPDYQRQYPESYEYFAPVCTRVERAQEEPEHLRNAYDNTIRYLDDCLASLIDSLRTISDVHTAILYVSDHGESLGENGLFMHGAPLKMAPREQYEIPFLLWMSDDFRTPKPTTEGVVIDQHYVFHTVLNFLGISSPVYDAEHDLLETINTQN